MPNPSLNPRYNKKVFEKIADKYDLDVSNVDPKAPRTKYEYDITLDDGKGAIPLSFIMNPNDTSKNMLNPSNWLFTNRCPDYPRMPNFDEKAYEGTWY